MQTIFITGAAAGIGREAARLFSGRGWFCGLYDVDDVGLAKLADELGQDRCVTGHLDVTDHDAFKEAVAAFGAATSGRMDVLFNNAGVLRMGLFKDVPIEAERLTVDVNVTGVVNGIHAAREMLASTAQAHGGARIVSMCSASAVYGVPELAVYSATKAAVRAITEALSLEFEKDGILVTDIMPAYVDTGMVQNQAYKAGSLAQGGISHTPQDIAQLAYEAATGPHKLHHMPNKQLRMLDRIARLMPGYARNAMRKLTLGEA